MCCPEAGYDDGLLAQPQAVSIVFKSGDAPGMLMIMHSERTYMELGEQMLQMMQRMAGAGGGADNSSSLNIDSVDDRRY